MKSKIYLNIIALCCISFQAWAQGGYKVENFKSVNSEHLDFSPIPYKNGIIFTSTRDSSCECKDKIAKDNYTDLYIANFSSNKISQLEGDLNGIHHDGVASATSDGNTLFISRTNKKGRRKDKIKDSKIYTLSKSEEKWLNGIEVPFNNNEWATCHPTISADGNKIYFASSRPGGYGGMDIWVASKVGDTWYEPKNLGPKVNTAKNEVFPYISAKNELYFASNGHEGAQNLDIYKASGNDFAKIERLEEPINSESDDFGFSMKDEYVGYFSSNRVGGLGGDDIYKWEREKIEPRAISVIDAKDLSQILKPSVSISAPDMETIVSSAEDVIILTPDPKKTYTITVNKGGYDERVITVAGAEMLTAMEYKVPINKTLPKGFMTKVIVRSQKDLQPLPNAKLIITKSCNGNKSEFVADANASAEFFVECNCNYTITAMQNGYKESTNNFSGPDCTKSAPATVFIDLDKVYKKGDLIQLKDIYYDYDKHDIRPDAALILDELVAIMKKYPSMEIDFGSHTDSRGSDIYNKSLSQRRTDSAKAYLVAQGIEQYRIIASGYGETVLLNHCKNGVKCSDEEHQLNRRTEVRVIKINEENVEVRKSN